MNVVVKVLVVPAGTTVEGSYCASARAWPPAGVGVLGLIQGRDLHSDEFHKVVVSVLADAAVADISIT